MENHYRKEIIWEINLNHLILSAHENIENIKNNQVDVAKEIANVENILI